MESEIKTRKKVRFIDSRFARLLILGITSILVFFSLIIPDLMDQTNLPMKVGDVATMDILAPYSLKYESAVLTDRLKQQAANTVTPIYLPADPSIGRYQIERLRVALNFITTVRDDAFSTEVQKLADLTAINDFILADDVNREILKLSDTSWTKISDQTTTVLEQIMRNTIRQDEAAQYIRSLPSLVDYSLSQDQTDIVVELVSPYIIANSLFSEVQTNALREQARAAIEPVIKSYVQGETLISRGQIIRDEHWEALSAYQLVEPENVLKTFISAATLVLILASFTGYYFSRQQTKFLARPKSLITVAVLLVAFLFLARFISYNRTILPYIFPVAAFGLSIALVFSLEAGIVFSLILGVLTAFGAPSGLSLSFYYIIPTIIGILTLSKAHRISSFLKAGFAVGISGAAIILVYRLTDSVTDWVGILTLCITAMAYGIAATALTLLLQYLLSAILQITTPLQLMEMSRPDHPLLQFILREAPGTYQHSLQVSNLAEQGAEKINANVLLVRVGALFHDCGKAPNAQFFIENQPPEQIDSHDDLDPADSAAIIIQHVTKGMELAKKHRIPPQISCFITEHHGTMLTRYQYSKAVKAAAKPEDVDIEQFRYPGPKPQSKETALLMLADGTEARARAERPKNDEELRELIKRVFDYYKNEGQLDETNLTMYDLSLVAESYYRTLRGTYHPRIMYPDNKKKHQK